MIPSQFKEKYGVEVEIIPHDAGVVYYGRGGKIILELQKSKQAFPAPATPVQFLSPFTVSYYLDGSTPKGQIYAATASYLHKSRTAADSQVITSLNDAFTLLTNTCAWIEISIDTDLTITAAELKTGTAFPALVVIAGSPLAQTKYNLPIGRVVADSQSGMPGFDFTSSGDPYHWQQLLQQHQIMLAECFSGTPIMAANGWQGI